MILKIAIGVVFIPLLLLNLVAPLLIKKLQKLPARVSFEAHDDREFLLSRPDEHHQLNAAIRSLDFDYMGSSFMQDSHTETNFSLYSNAKDQTIAMIVSMVNDAKSITYVEFSQMYADGSMFDVSNAAQIPVYPKMDLKTGVRFPEVDDPRELYARFNKVKASLVNKQDPLPFNRETGFTRIEEFMARESDILVNKGYCSPDIDADGKRALTLKGAYLITWKSVFPGKKIMAFLDKAYSSRVLKNA